jgi:glycosyltransferase involved in cell wall biosynthesis
MKIAFLSYDFPEYCVRHANAMAHDHDVLLMLPKNQIGEAEKLIDRRVRYEGFFRPRYRQPFQQLKTVAKIVRMIRSFQPDVVHFQNGHLFFNAFLPLLRKFPLVITIHDPRQHLGDQEALITPQWVMDFGFRRACQVIIHGADLIETVNREIKIPKDQIHVIPHIAIGARPESPADLETTPNILFFGRIWEYKGLDFLIKAEPIVSAVFPDVKIVIGGKGEDFDRYRRMMVHPERFEIRNEWISDADRAKMFAESSMVVLPYVEASQSGVIPIAYTFGKPVIATTVGGLPEMVEHDKTGLLVAPRDIEGLAAAIIQLLGDRNLRKRMGIAGRDKLTRECDPTVVVRQTIAVYERAIALKKGLPLSSPILNERSMFEPTTSHEATLQSSRDRVLS